MFHFRISFASVTENMVFFTSSSKLILTVFQHQCRNYTRRSTGLSKIPRNRFDKAGVAGQIKLHGYAEEHELDITENMDDMEGDFYQMATAHRQFEKEQQARDEQLQYHIVKRKYFKPSVRYNFLTWSEKLQIRNLHEKDPIEWSIDSLAESFPATGETIAKIIKNKWEPKNTHRTQKHDDKVKETWNLFNQNKITDLDEELREHLKKFSNRNFDSRASMFGHESNAKQPFKFPESKSKEFTTLITSMNKIVKKNEHSKAEKVVEGPKSEIQLIESHSPVEKSAVERAKASDEDTFIIGTVSGHTYQKYEDVKRVMNKGTMQQIEEKSVPLRFNNNDENDEAQQTERKSRAIEVTVQTKPDENIVNLEKKDLLMNIQKYQTRNVPARTITDQIQVQNSRRIRDKIYIPRKLYKKGKIYKLYDCFYDDDGEFLYRVPNLTGTRFV